MKRSKVVSKYLHDKLKLFHLRHKGQWNESCHWNERRERKDKSNIFGLAAVEGVGNFFCLERDFGPPFFANMLKLGLALKINVFFGPWTFPWIVLWK